MYIGMADALSAILTRGVTPDLARGSDKVRAKRSSWNSVIVLSSAVDQCDDTI
jgi:hypothetical protein